MDDDNFYESNENVKNANEYINNAFLSTLDKDTFFKLPKSTIKALELIPKLKHDGLPDTSSNSGGSSSRSNTTVYSVLNKCRTVSGQKLLAVWLQHPLKCREKITIRLEIVQQFIDNIALRNMCYDDYLRKVPDLMRLAFKIKQDKCTLNDLMKIYNTCRTMKELCSKYEHLSKNSDLPADSKCDAINNLFEWLNNCCINMDDFMQFIEESIDVNQTDESGEYNVKSECDNAIAKLTIEISSYYNKARQLLRTVADDIGLEADKTVKLETDSEKGFGFKITKQNEQSVRGLSNYEQLSTVKKDGYRFTNHTLNKLSDRYVSAKQDYKTAAKNIIDELKSKVTIFDQEILELSMAITMTDVFVSLAIAANQNNYSFPLILDSDGGKIQFERLRHPCVECQPDVENYVPNDLILDRESKNFYMITGPNMGGKSTFIKSVAIGTLMAQIGSLVPAEDSRVSIVDGIFTRIGAGDKQMEGISTFMEEMMDMSYILESATQNSLVIIDELGRGTSTFDGFGLAWAISKHLAHETKCYALFATHFLELTELENEVSTVGNLNVKALCEEDKLTMLFDVGPGICDDSYGINVAKYTKFPDRVIDVAKERLKQFEEVPGFASKQEVRDFVKDCVNEYKKQYTI